VGLAVLVQATVPSWSPYKHYGATDVPYATYSTVASGDARAACDKDVKCAAYNSKGALKRCAGCEGGSDCCVSVQTHTLCSSVTSCLTYTCVAARAHVGAASL
jgi:hypothetical protein